MKFCIFDIETDGLLDTVSKIHCLSYQIYENTEFISKGTLFGHQTIADFMNSEEIRSCYKVCHNGVRYDKKVLIKLLNVSIEDVLDTLGMSWYLYPYRKKHGLEVWGEELGVEKPKIEDWENLSLEEYAHRCEEDVEINVRLFHKLFGYILEIYQSMEDAINYIKYLGFKLECLSEQEDIGIPLNVDLVNKHLRDLEPIFQEKTELLSKAIPLRFAKVIKARPKQMFKKDHSLSANALKWIQYLRDNNLPPETEEHREECNPGSDTQLKGWLFSLGWKPETFKVSKSVKNKGEKIPQVSLPYGQGLCPSVKALYEVEPVLQELDGYFRIRHRIGVFKSFLKHLKEDGKVYATAHGFTNTMRLTHSEPIVNLPKPGVYYGKEIREVLTIPDDSYVMIGSDVSGLEDNTKQHYIYPYDPEYVEQMRVPGFDPHIDIGVLAGLVTKEEEKFFKYVESLSDEEKEKLSSEEKTKFKKIKEKRGTSKVSNFAMTYNAFPPKVAETAKISLEEAENLFDTYWGRNWAIKKIADNATVKWVRGQKWIFNPLSGYWMFLKADKDRFSTINQSSGVFVFDTWIYIVKKKLNELGIRICMQYHDEMLFYCKKEYKEIVADILRTSMKEVNKKLNLNVEITISVDFGENYAECH